MARAFHVRSLSWLKLACASILLLTAMPALANLPVCEAVFPETVQSHKADGEITFDWNAQLLGSTSTALTVARVNDSSWSVLPSCGTAACTSAGGKTSALNLTFETSSATLDQQVIYRGTQTLGSNQVNRFRNIKVGSEGVLSFAAIATDYHIKHLSLEYGATLNLAPGTYWIETLTLATASKIQVTGEGSARLLVKNHLSFPWQAFANMTALDNPGNAAKLFIYAENDLTLQSGSQVSAIVYTNKRLSVAQAKLYGRASFHHANLGTSARIQHQLGAIADTHLTGICNHNSDEDNNVPELPYDENIQQLNACQAAFSNGLQTHGNNGLVAFQYNSQLLNASSPVLHAASMQINTGSSRRSCDTSHCTAGNTSAQQLDAGSFLRTPASRNFSVAWMGNAVVDGDTALEYGRITVAGGATLTLTSQSEPYLIRELRLGYQSTLKLPAGDYWVEELALESEVSIQSLGQGTVRLYVEKGLSIPWMTTINDNTQNPAQFILYQYGDLVFNSGSRADAFVYGKGQVRLGFQAQLTGAISANRILLDTESKVIYKPDAVSNAEFGPICTDTSPQPDLTPPQLSIGPLPQEIAESLILITGTVIDPPHPQGGIADVVISSNRLPGITFDGDVQGQSFSVEVPLHLGDNILSIVARDLSNNVTQVTRQIRRLSIPQFSQLTPATGSILSASSVTLAGEVHTPSPFASIRFYINEWLLTLDASATPGTYKFIQSGISLEPGENTFVLRVETPDGTAESPIVLTYNPENPDAIPLPSLSLLAPISGSYLRDTTFLLRGQVTSYAGAARVTVNGQPLERPSTSGQAYYFETPLSFLPEQDSLQVLIEARDGLGRASQLTAQYHRDDSAPQIVVNDGLQPSPTINPVIQSPFTISGTVIDTNLTSLTLNDQPIFLQPGSSLGRYDFSVPVQIASGEQSHLLFDAYDMSGNRTSVEYIFQSNAQLGITPLMPGNEAEFIAHGESITLQAAARLSLAEPGYKVWVSVGAEQFELSVAGTLASGDITLPATAGDYTLRYQVVDEEQQIVASAERRVSVIDDQAIPVAVVRHAPENNAINIEPNQPIEIYFNKPITLSDLTLRVRETLHGDTYINLDASGTDFLNARGYQLQKVHRDNEDVPGAVSLLPGNQSLAFYGARHFGFNAHLYVDVIYQDTELARFNFRVRPLPTFAVGGVVDQFGNPLPGIAVSLSGFGKTRTNQDGSFAFGFQQSADDNLPGGRLRLEVNPDFEVPGYGMQVRTINLQAGRRNEISLTRLPELHPDIPFQLVRQGQAEVSLANDELRLDLSEARLVFNLGRTSGQIQAQFIPFNQINSAMTPGAWPQWLFAIQPRGIAVEGLVGIAIDMPALNGSHDYISPETRHVVLLGYDLERELVEPVGIGRVEHQRVISVGKVNIKALDYLGYALVDPALEPHLQAVAEGTLSLPELLSALRK